MKSTKCISCGFVGWSDAENCKGCGAPLVQRSESFQAPQVHASNFDSWQQPQEGVKKGLAILALVLGILSFLTFGLLGIGAIAGIVVAVVAMKRVTNQPWQYGGRGMAVAGLVLSIVSLVTLPTVGVIAAIAIPNLLASRRAANEGSAIYSLRQIASAEAAYYSNFQKYATLEELAANGLIDPALATGARRGYNFTVELTSDYPNPDGFAVIGVPAEYRTTGTRSFYADESFVIRGADNHGGPSSKMDAPLDSGSEFPPTRRAQRTTF